MAPARDGDHGHGAPSVPANLCTVEGFACDAKLERTLRAGLGADGSELAVTCGVQRRPQPEDGGKMKSFNSDASIVVQL